MGGGAAPATAGERSPLSMLPIRTGRCSGLGDESVHGCAGLGKEGADGTATVTAAPPPGDPANTAIEAGGGTEGTLGWVAGARLR